MNDPRRLIDASGTPLVAQLLAAGRQEAPSRELVERFARSVATSAIGVGGIVTGTSSAAASGGAAAGSAAAGGAAASGGAATGSAAAGGAAAGAVAQGAGGAALLKGGLASAVLTKWLGVGFIAATAAVATPQVLRWVEPGGTDTATSPAPSVAATAAASVPTPVQRTPNAGGEDLGGAARAAPPAAAAADSREHREPVLGSARHQTPSSAPRASRFDANNSSAKPPRNLGAELALVDQARVALAGGDALRALQELETYERAFPARQLELEVTMLRMQAHLQRGDTSTARQLAQRILAGPTSDLHARRAREVLEATAPPP